jgi:Homeodomain-like domain-containing protein
MRKKLPPIHESAEELHQRMKREPDSKKRQRLHALYLVASGQARHRKDVASLLGVHRHSVAAWFEAYATGGVDQALHYHVATPLKWLYSAGDTGPRPIVPLERGGRWGNQRGKPLRPHARSAPSHWPSRRRNRLPRRRATWASMQRRSPPGLGQTTGWSAKRSRAMRHSSRRNASACGKNMRPGQRRARAEKRPPRPARTRGRAGRLEPPAAPRVPGASPGAAPGGPPQW